jgi:hypothetical protein
MIIQGVSCDVIITVGNDLLDLCNKIPINVGPLLKSYLAVFVFFYSHKHTPTSHVQIMQRYDTLRSFKELTGD